MPRRPPRARAPPWPPRTPWCWPSACATCPTSPRRWPPTSRRAAPGSSGSSPRAPGPAAPRPPARSAAPCATSPCPWSSSCWSPTARWPGSTTTTSTGTPPSAPRPSGSDALAEQVEGGRGLGGDRLHVGGLGGGPAGVVEHQVDVADAGVAAVLGGRADADVAQEHDQGAGQGRLGGPVATDLGGPEPQVVGELGAGDGHPQLPPGGRGRSGRLGAGGGGGAPGAPRGGGPGGRGGGG